MNLKNRLILNGLTGVILFILGIIVLIENLKNPTGYALIITGVVLTWLTQKKIEWGSIMKRKNKEPLFHLEASSTPEKKELDTDGKIEQFGTNIKKMNEQFTKERTSELNMLKKEYAEMNKLKITIEKNVVNEEKQYRKLKENMKSIETMVTQKGLIEQKK